MKTYLMILLSCCLLACSKEKGCTDVNSLAYNPSAEENDGSCSYLSGSYSMTETCSSEDHFTVTIPENGVNFTIHNFAHILPSVSAWRNGLSITINEQDVDDSHGFSWRVKGKGTISANGKMLWLDYTLDGESCSASGSK
jgi:hypothetical protein